MHFETFRRSIIGIGNDRSINQVHSMEMNANSGSGIQCELGSFEHQVFRRFRVLSGSPDEEILNLNWVSKLLEAFIGCLDDFKGVMSVNGPNLSKPPLDRFVTEFFDVIVKGLDICNAVCDGVEKIRRWNKHLDIVSTAFDSKSRNVMVEGQFRRAKRGLADLAMIMFDNNNNNNNNNNQSSSFFAYRNRSSVGLNKGKDNTNNQKAGHARSMTWTVPNSWSASKQLQLIANGLVPPKSHEISATNGLANVVYTMGFVLMFVLWALVSALPCQDRTFQVQFSVPRQFSWGTPLSLLHTRIVDESKKRERKSNVGLLKEIQQMEKSIQLVTGLVDSVNQFPLTEEQKEEVKTGVKQVSQVCEVFKNGLGPLERQLREVFHLIMACRTDGLEVMGRASS